MGDTDTDRDLVLILGWSTITSRLRAEERHPAKGAHSMHRVRTPNHVQAESEADGPVRGEVDGTQERMDWPLSVLGRRPSPAHFLRAGILVAKDIRPTTL